MVANNNSQMQRGRILRIAVGITMLVLLLAGSAGASTLTVNASGGADYTRIQDAIDNASVGDTILVYNGTYYENVNVTKQLTLRGIGMPLVNASGRGNAIMLATDGISLEGFTAIGGGYSYREAGIKVISNNNTLIGNDASNNYGQESASGKGIYLVSSSNNTLIGNNANGNKDYAGVGIRLEYSNNNILSSNNANRNDGIGISMESSNNNTLIGNNASIDLRSSSNNTLSATLLT